ncbi:MAG: clostripain-related cysteine peptidase [Candidatus Muirbacterium halophilum]|nr:clostripain-related cysteine peptidase [Candidatus Muirbacterium halophilum]
MKKLLGFIMIFMICFAMPYAEEAKPVDNTDNSEEQIADWTVFVYMCADNDLEPFAFFDLNEMEQIGSSKKLNIIALVDRWDGYDWKYGPDGTPVREKSDKYNMHEFSNKYWGEWSTAKLYYVTKDEDVNAVSSLEIKDLGEIDTGNPKTLESILGVVMKVYKAKNYFTVIWNHGNGIEGVGYDDQASLDKTKTDGKYVYMNKSKLSGPELGKVFSNVVAKITAKDEVKMDMVGFDACLMSMYSHHYELASNGVKTVIGSQELEPGNGWPYMDILYYLRKMTDESKAVTTNNLATWIARRYIASYEKDQVTMACVKTDPVTALDAVNAKIDALIDKILSSEENMLKLHEAAKISQRYNTGNEQMDKFVYYVDLIDFIKNIEQGFDKETAELAKAVIDEIGSQKIIIANEKKGSLVKDSNGIAIYFPLYRRAKDKEGNAYLIKPYITDTYKGYVTEREIFKEFKFGSTSKWDKMLVEYYKAMESKTDEEVAL